MTTLPAFPLYTQSRLDDDAVVATFVANHDLLDRLLAILRAQGKGAAGEHHLLIGPHGMGKTTLLRRLAIAIEQDEALADRFIPLRFREEQHNVLGLDVLWRNCADSLAEWCDANGFAPTAERLSRAPDPEVRRDPAAAAQRFLGACREIGRRPVLLLDNLDLILESLNEYQKWDLRGVMQRADGPIVIGAAAESLARSGDRQAAFHAFFRLHTLDPLPADTMCACLRALADLRRAAGAPVRAILDRQPARLRTLYTLTGGNPRVLTLLYQLLERAETDTAFADLEALLDQVTPVHKARVEHYQTAQQRAVIDAIALHWDPIPSGALARVTGMEVTTVSSHLARLKKSGFVQEVPTSGARAGYQLAERFLNIWYLSRHGTRKTRQKLRWLTVFLTRLHSAGDMGRLAEAARPDGAARPRRSEEGDAVIPANEDIGAVSTQFPDDVTTRADDAGSLQAASHIAWHLLAQGRLTEAAEVRPDPERLDPMDARLLEAGFALARDAGAAALDHLGAALDAGPEPAGGSITDLLHCLRLAEARGHGDRLIEWFEASGAADRYAPVHAALVASVRGERFLLDVNPEVRAPARVLYERLLAPRCAAEAAAAANQRSKAANETRRRGRRRAGR